MIAPWFPSGRAEWAKDGTALRPGQTGSEATATPSARRSEEAGANAIMRARRPHRQGLAKPRGIGAKWGLIDG